MSRLVLLLVGAAWLAVLLPPVFRGRVDGGPSSSVSAFRQQLQTLQRGYGPVRQQVPMRQMARPLAPAPQMRRSAPPLPGRGYGSPMGRESAGAYGAAPNAGAVPYGMEDPRASRHLHLADPSLDRPVDEPRHRRAHHGRAGLDATHPGMRSHHAMVASLSPAEMLRRRRLNVLYGLIGANAGSLFLAFSTGSTGMTWIFAVAALALIGYCYVLVQLRTQAQMRRYRDYYRAA